MDLRDSILGLLQNAPVTARWVHTLHQLYFRLMQGASYSSSVPVTQIAARWQSLPADSTESRDGLYSELPRLDEFIAVICGLHGRHTYKKDGDYQYGSEIVGALDSQTLEQRCAAYGALVLSPAQMYKALERDGEAMCSQPCATTSSI